jgi:hypothetical protein
MNPTEVPATTEVTTNRRDARSTQETSNEIATRTVSPKMLASNRRNARRSTGPRTAAGKLASRMNAVRHGILSSAVVVRGLRIREHEEEFQVLREECWKCLAPVGRIEEMLADKIVTAQWRLRRALMAETGEIVLSVDGGRHRRANREPLPLGIFANPFQDGAAQMEKSTQGLEYLKAVLKFVRRDVESEGELTQATCDQVLERFMNKPNFLTRELLGYRERMATEATEGLSPEELKDTYRRAVLRFIEEKLVEYAELSNQSEEREEKEETARQAANILPEAEVLEKILRYERELNRELYRAMNQLERLQRRRGGEELMPPLMMDVMR